MGNHIRLLPLVALLAADTVSPGAAASAPEPWQDPAVNSENRMPARTYLPYEGFVLPLDGTWSFAWEGCADGPLAKCDLSTAETPFSIDVPSCVETRGWGVPHYVNVRYPHPKTPPTIDPKYNPTMLYRRSFNLPEGWKGRRIVLRFEGVASCCEVWLNGRRVGYFEDARLPSEFDVTGFVSFGGASGNVLSARVRKWCDGSYVEDQDMIRYAGIFRSVSVRAEPIDGIYDFSFTTVPDADYASWTCRLELFGGGNAARPRLLDASGGEAGSFVPAPGGGAAFVLRLTSPRLWSDEDPYLYSLDLGDGRRAAVGVRECKVEGGRILVNGRPVKFKGVNRHEMSADNGYALSAEEMERDARMMRRGNINCVRMAHYPNDRRMYALCDRYGIYVMSEANVESHGMGYGRDCMPELPEWHATMLERNLRQVLFYRNSPSVVMWSVGNEMGWGAGIAKCRDAVKRLDPTRPFHGVGWIGVDDGVRPWNDASDMTGGQYMSLDALRAQLADPRPHFQMEYECAMGNGMGNLREYWDLFYTDDKFSGGCIWDWMDQATWKATDRIGPDGRAVRLLAYGGDHDEQPNDGPFCANGLVDALARPSAKLNEVKHVQQPVVVECADASSGKAVIWNRHEFTFADDAVDGVWELSADGVKVASGALDVPHVPPRGRSPFALPVPSCRMDPAKECFYRVSFRLKKGTPWAEAGYEIAWNQLPYGKPPTRRRSSGDASSAAPAFVASPDAIIVTSPRISATFSRATGTLSELVMSGKRILADRAGVVAGPRLQVERAFTDSDGWMRGPFFAAGLSQLSFHPRPMSAARNADGSVCVTAPVLVTGAKSGGFEHVARWTFRADGAVDVENEMTPFGDVPALPRVGTFMRLDGVLEDMLYYGRGPWENAVDRNSGCDVGLYRSTVAGQYVDYIRPQDCGGRTDVRWAEFTDPADGRGVRVSGDGSPFMMQALHFTREDLDKARHRPGEVRQFNPPAPRAEVCLSIDCRQTGLGCNNCGPIPLPQYRFPVERTVWRFRMEPVTAAGR